MGDKVLVRKGETASEYPLGGALGGSPVMIRRSVFLPPGIFVFQRSRPLRARRITRARPSFTWLTAISLFSASPTPFSVQPVWSISSLVACVVRRCQCLDQRNGFPL